MEDSVELATLLDQVQPLLVNYVDQCNLREVPVVDHKAPDELMASLNLDLPNKPGSIEKVIEDLKDALSYSVKSINPRFSNQLYGGSDVVGNVTELVGTFVNAAVHTFNAAPVFSLMEKSIIKKVAELIGFDPDTCDGTLCPGGTFSNLTAFLVARNEALPTGKKEGLYGAPKLVAFTSPGAHYSLASAAHVIGVGVDNVIQVPAVDDKMIPEELDRLLTETKSAGNIPFIVASTAGTTVLGSFDRIRDIAEICRKHNVWFHVDASWGGMSMLSPKHRHLLDGAELANSVVWNPHKGLGVPQQCSCLVLRQAGLLRKWNSQKASYLYHSDDDFLEPGDKTLQCGRRNDALKFFVAWRYYGLEGFRQRVEHYFAMRDYLVQQLKARANDGFSLVIEDPQYLNVCFWYTPTWLRKEADPAVKQAKLGNVTASIVALMRQCGSFMINYQPQNGRPNFFRMVFTNRRLEKSDLDFLLQEIKKHGEELLER